MAQMDFLKEHMYELLQCPYWQLKKSPKKGPKKITKRKKYRLNCLPHLGRQVAALPRCLERGGVRLRAAFGHLQLRRGGAVDPAAVLRAAVIALGDNSTDFRNHLKNGPNGSNPKGLLKRLCV